jgi:hypothetical protein
MWIAVAGSHRDRHSEAFQSACRELGAELAGAGTES